MQVLYFPIGKQKWNLTMADKKHIPIMPKIEVLRKNAQASSKLRARNAQASGPNLTP